MKSQAFAAFYATVTKHALSQGQILRTAADEKPALPRPDSAL
jgi:hypothetical protein